MANRDHAEFARAVTSARVFLETEQAFAPARFHDPGPDIVVALMLESERFVRAVMASDNPETWDALRRGVLGIIEAGEPLPAAVRPFLVAVLNGEQGPKQRPGRRSNDRRDWLLGAAVEFVCERHGLLPTRDSTRAVSCSAVGGSAVDACGVAMRELFGAHVSFLGWSRAWRRYKAHATAEADKGTLALMC